MTRPAPLVLVFAAAVPILTLLLGRSDRGTAPFQAMVVPAGIAGDCKAVGDLDGDGRLDLVVAGKGELEPLTWFEHGSWVPRPIAVAEEEYSNDCAIADVDGDGWSDIVVPDGTVEPQNLFWFENPGPDTSSPDASWTRHGIGHTDAWCKDVRVLDVDQDGRLDVVAKPEGLSPRVYFQLPSGDWARRVLKTPDPGREGLAVGDIDLDGAVDVVVRGAWLRNPVGGAARTGSEWTLHAIGEAPDDFKALVVDLDRDDDPDILFSSSEAAGSVDWWEQTDGGWNHHAIAKVVAAHTLQAADVDGDGDVDVVTAELGRARLTVHQNVDGNAERWRSVFIPSPAGPVHNAVAADLDDDGDTDVFGAGFTGQPATATLWWNRYDPGRLSVGPFHYIELTADHVRAFGSAFADLDRDGFIDVAAGPFWYRNPGGDMTASWAQQPLPRPDGQTLDALAGPPGPLGRGPALAAVSRDGRVWSIRAREDGLHARYVADLPTVDHGISSQGSATAVLARELGPELLLSNGGDAATGVGIYAFRMARDGPWTRRRITSRTSDEGLAVGDVDRDGDLDVVGTRGDLGEVEWYENPGGDGEDWPAHLVGVVQGVEWLDRVELGDLSGDGRLDVVVTEENGAAGGALTAWWEQPGDLRSEPWRVHVVGRQGSTNSLDMADFDRDGDPDIVTGEHRGAHRVVVWENTDGGSLTRHVVDHGKESHLGTRAIDLDGDGDLDLVSIAWTDPSRIHLWRNDSVR